MEAVSAVKMRKSLERALSSRAYAAAALSVLERLSGSIDVARHPLLQTQEGKTCFVVITMTSAARRLIRVWASSDVALAVA